MFRYLFLEILVPVLIFALVRSILRTLFSSKGAGAAPPPAASFPGAQQRTAIGGELKKDPVCGTYVSTQASVTRKVNGELLHFCSAECRDKYRAA